MHSVSIDGYRVFTNGSVQGKYGKMLRPRIDGGGYHRIVFSHGKLFQHQKSVHRLVAQLFIFNPGNKPEVNHINRDKSDNRIENLEWVTRGENSLHTPSQKGRIGIRGKIVLDLQTGIFYTNIKQAAESVNMPYKNLAARLGRNPGKSRFVKV